MDRATPASYDGDGAVAREVAGMMLQWHGEAGARRHGREVVGAGSRWRAADEGARRALARETRARLRWCCSGEQWRRRLGLGQKQVRMNRVRLWLNNPPKHDRKGNQKES